MLKNCTLNFLPIRQNSNVHLRKYNNCGDDSSNFLPYYGHLWYTVVPENTYLSSNNIPESIYSVLPFLRIAGKKYRILSSKIDTATEITIHRMNERVKSTKILQVTDYNGVIHLIINLKDTVIVGDPGSHFRNIPHSTRLFFCETNGIYSQYRTKTTKYPYL